MNRNTWILAGVLAVLLVAGYFVMQRPGETSSTGSTGKMLVDYDSSRVDKIEVRSPGGSTVLEKLGTVWMLTAPVRYHADNAAVASAISGGKNIELKNLVSSNPQKQGVFQVDTGGTEVRLFAEGAVKAAFWIGKPSPSFIETYVRREGSDDVYLASGLFSSSFSRKANEWRDKTIFKTDQESISGVTLRFGDTTVALVRQDSIWRIGSDTAKAEQVKSFLGAVANVQADDFIDTAVAEMPKLTVQIEIGGIQLRLYWKKEGDRYYVQSSDSPQLFAMYSWRATQLIKRKKDFLG